jgi:hypothetical protein
MGGRGNATSSLDEQGEISGWSFLVASSKGRGGVRDEVELIVCYAVEEGALGWGYRS